MKIIKNHLEQQFPNCAHTKIIKKKIFTIYFFILYFQLQKYINLKGYVVL